MRLPVSIGPARREQVCFGGRELAPAFPHPKAGASSRPPKQRCACAWPGPTGPAASLRLSGLTALACLALSFASAQEPTAAPGGEEAGSSPTTENASSTAPDANAPEAADVDVDEGEEEFVDEYATVAADVSDPFEGVNRTIFKFNNTIYRHVLRPVSRGYETVVPSPVRRGLTNFFDNVETPVRLVSCVLQGKFDRAGAETGKFALNTTIGLAGFIKVSDEYPMLRVPEEDIGQAFGRWGISPGPFLVLPVLGPSSLRDGVGLVGDYYLTPTNWEFMRQEEDWVRYTVQAVDAIAGLPDRLATHDALHRSAVDPYTAFRNAYLQYREGEVAK